MTVATAHRRGSGGVRTPVRAIRRGYFPLTGASAPASLLPSRGDVRAGRGRGHRTYRPSAPCAAARRSPAESWHGTPPQWHGISTSPPRIDAESGRRAAPGRERGVAETGVDGGLASAGSMRRNPHPGAWPVINGPRPGARTPGTGTVAVDRADRACVPAAQARHRRSHWVIRLDSHAPGGGPDVTSSPPAFRRPVSGVLILAPQFATGTPSNKVVRRAGHFHHARGASRNCWLACPLQS